MILGSGNTTILLLYSRTPFLPPPPPLLLPPLLTTISSEVLLDSGTTTIVQYSCLSLLISRTSTLPSSINYKVILGNSSAATASLKDTPTPSFSHPPPNMVVGGGVGWHHVVQRHIIFTCLQNQEVPTRPPPWHGGGSAVGWYHVVQGRVLFTCLRDRDTLTWIFANSSRPFLKTCHPFGAHDWLGNGYMEEHIVL